MKKFFDELFIDHLKASLSETGTIVEIDAFKIVSATFRITKLNDNTNVVSIIGKNKDGKTIESAFYMEEDAEVKIETL